MENPSTPSRRLADSVSIELPGMVILSAILVFFLVVVLVFLLQLYARWLWSRIEEPIPHPPETRRHRRHTVQGKGLDPAVLCSLPVLIFSPESFRDGLECSVCLSDVVQGEKVKLLPDCSHGFHIDCIDMWLQSHSTCPLCRNPVNPQLQEENAASGSSSDSPNFPTNVLFWGNQAQVITLVGASSSNSDAELVIDIQNETQLRPSASRTGDEEWKLPVSTRLRSLKRLLSRERRVSTPCNPISIDSEMEQVAGGQS